MICHGNILSLIIIVLLWLINIINGKPNNEFKGYHIETIHGTQFIEFNFSQVKPKSDVNGNYMIDYLPLQVMEEMFDYVWYTGLLHYDVFTPKRRLMFGKKNRVDPAKQAAVQVALDSRMNDLNSRIGTISNKMAMVDTTFNGFKNRLDQFEGRFDKYYTRAQLEARIDGINQGVSNFDSRISMIENRMNLFEKRMGVIQERMDMIEERMNVFEKTQNPDSGMLSWFADQTQNGNAKKESPKKKKPEGNSLQDGSTAKKRSRENDKQKEPPNKKQKQG